MPSEAEAFPAPDETLPEIGANLADDEELCKKVTAYIVDEHLYPYWLMQQRMWDTWRRADNAWSGKYDRDDLDMSQYDEKNSVKNNATPDGKGRGFTDPKDGRTTKFTPASVHQQVDAICNMGISLSFGKGGFPFRAQKPEHVFESPTYNPTTQAVEAANVLLRKEGKEEDLRILYRRALGQYLRYGHVAVMRDLERRFEDVQEPHLLRPGMESQDLALLRQRYGKPETQVVPSPQGAIAIFTKRYLRKFVTKFIPLAPDDLFIDELIGCMPMEQQPCPIVRKRITEYDLFGNRYDDQTNPFGWRNVELAWEENKGHYILANPDEKPLRDRLQKKWGISDTLLTRPEKTYKSLWTASAMLRLDPETREFDPTGQGIACQHCGGKGTMDVEMGDGSIGQQGCEACAGKGKKYIEARRYCVQMFGGFFAGMSTTCLRIQLNPTSKNKVPIVFAQHLVEDMAGARAVSKCSIAENTFQQLCTAHGQFHDSKEITIKRPWLVRSDSIAAKQKLNVPDGKIFWDSDPNEAQRCDASAYDESTTLIPYIQMLDGQLVDIFGARDSIIGDIFHGRRSALEAGNAADAAKNPIVVLVDGFNQQVFGGEHGWAQAVLDDMEVWGDRDWMIRNTGRPTWGKVQIDTAVGEEALQKIVQNQNIQYLIQTLGNNPMLQPAMPGLVAQLIRNMGLEIDESLIDGGYRKNLNDAMRIVATILGDGQFLPAEPSDPHQLYIQTFTEALKDPHWREKAPQHFPLLIQRLDQQNMYFMQQMMQQMQIQAASQPQLPAGQPGNEPRRPNAPVANKGQEMQHAQG